MVEVAAVDAPVTTSVAAVGAPVSGGVKALADNGCLALPALPPELRDVSGGVVDKADDPSKIEAISAWGLTLRILSTRDFASSSCAFFCLEMIGESAFVAVLWRGRAGQTKALARTTDSAFSARSLPLMK